MVIMFETKGESKGVILLLALSSDTIHQPAYAHKQNQHPKTNRTQLNGPKYCRGKVGGMGYRELYLGVKHPSVRLFSSIDALEQMESWHPQRSKPPEKEAIKSTGNSIIPRHWKV